MSLPITRKEAQKENNPLYDTGVLCRYGHGSVRYTSNGYCRVCSNDTTKKWREKSQNKVKEYRALYRATDHGSSLHAKNQQDREARKLKAAKYADDEFNMFCLQEAYSLAKVRTKVTGIKHHVDHVLPLRGVNVCGFHSWNNVQVIPASVNVKKSNTFEGI